MAGKRDTSKKETEKDTERRNI